MSISVMPSSKRSMTRSSDRSKNDTDWNKKDSELNKKELDLKPKELLLNKKGLDWKDLLEKRQKEKG